MTQLRVLLADDERPARAFLSGILQHFEDVELVGEAASGAECIEMIERLTPDLVFLDLQMPEAHGDAESDHPAEIIGIHVGYGLPTQRRNHHGHARSGG